MAFMISRKPNAQPSFESSNTIVPLRSSKSSGISGVSLSNINVSFLRHGKIFLKRQMTVKNIKKGKVWKGINRQELSNSAKTGSLSSKGSLVKDPVVFGLSENLPEGEYELRIEAIDRAGNKTVNGKAVKSKDKDKSIRSMGWKEYGRKLSRRNKKNKKG